MTHWRAVRKTPPSRLKIWLAVFFCFYWIDLAVIAVVLITLYWMAS